MGKDIRKGASESGRPGHSSDCGGYGSDRHGFCVRRRGCFSLGTVFFPAGRLKWRPSRSWLGGWRYSSSWSEGENCHRSRGRLELNHRAEPAVRRHEIAPLKAMRSHVTSSPRNHRLVKLATFGIIVGLVLFQNCVGVCSETLRYTYDTLGRLIHISYGDSNTIDYVYDAMGNRLLKATTVPGGPPNQPPTAVNGPSIPNGATNVTLTPILSWNPATD